MCYLFEESTCELCDGTPKGLCEPTGTEKAGAACVIPDPSVQIIRWPILGTQGCREYCRPKSSEDWREAKQVGPKSTMTALVNRKVCDPE